MERVDVAYGLICQDNQVLIVHNVGGTWSLPGGAVEKTETLEQAVVREVKEETGLTVVVDHLVAVNEAFVQKNNHHAIFFTFIARVIDGIPSVQSEDEISAVEWVDVQTASERMPYYAEGVEKLLQYKVPYVFQG